MAALPDIALEARFASHPRYLQLVRLVAGEGAVVAGFGEEDRDRIELAVVEGFTNVIRHGYGGRTDQPVSLRLTVPADVLRLELDDWGTFVDPALICSRPLDQIRPGGLGVHLMKSTMDLIEYRKNAHGGTTLVLEKRRRTNEGEPR